MPYSREKVEELLKLQRDKCASQANHQISFRNNETSPPEMFHNVLHTKLINLDEHEEDEETVGLGCLFLVFLFVLFFSC